MTSNEFWLSVQAIIRDGFTTLGLQKLEEYAERFISNRIVYQRFSPAEQHGCIAGGASHVIASLLAGAEVETDQFSAPAGSFKRDVECGAAQARRIEAWAKASDCWISNTDKVMVTALGEQIAQGGEAQVYDHGATVIKTIGLDYFVQPILALDRISLHNAYFPQTRMTVLGFGRNGKGAFQIVVEQPFIQGGMMADGEIEQYVHALGFRLVNPKNWTYATEEIYLSDMHDENVLRSAKGNVFVIDCDIRINTPELKAGGTRKLVTHILWRE